MIMKTNRKVNILGQEYNIVFVNEKENPKLELLEANGLAELYSKELIINSEIDDGDKRTYNSINLFENKVIRHEIIHAFFHESGMSNYCSDEILVEWIAQQIIKMNKAFKEVGCDE